MTSADAYLRQAMRPLFNDMKHVSEPATAALFGPLRSRLPGKRVSLVLCGANIDAAGFYEFIREPA